mmetsp:Transcript_46828/g.144970  ORF Transcript_46828/g.144970 Transcript_46828/m.144970 type:complete len:230 (-) Transcript_46828:24-713(-)
MTAVVPDPGPASTQARAAGGASGLPEDVEQRRGAQRRRLHQGQRQDAAVGPLQEQRPCRVPGAVPDHLDSVGERAEAQHGCPGSGGSRGRAAGALLALPVLLQDHFHQGLAGHEVQQAGRHGAEPGVHVVVQAVGDRQELLPAFADEVLAVDADPRAREGHAQAEAALVRGEGQDLALLLLLLSVDDADDGVVLSDRRPPALEEGAHLLRRERRGRAEGRGPVWGALRA